jgi:hypothetical protein
MPSEASGRVSDEIFRDRKIYPKNLSEALIDFPTHFSESFILLGRFPPNRSDDGYRRHLSER